MIISLSISRPIYSAAALKVGKSLVFVSAYGQEMWVIINGCQKIERVAIQCKWSGVPAVPSKKLN